MIIILREASSYVAITTSSFWTLCSFRRGNEDLHQQLHQRWCHVQLHIQRVRVHSEFQVRVPLSSILLVLGNKSCVVLIIIIIRVCYLIMIWMLLSLQTSEFIIAVGQLIIALSFSTWYFTRDKSTIGPSTVYWVRLSYYYYILCGKSHNAVNYC